MKIALFHANAGYGHRKIAEVIETEFKKLNRADIDVTLEDALDSTPAWFKYGYPALYFNSVKYTPWGWGFGYEFFDLKIPYLCLHPLRTFVNRLVGKHLLNRVCQDKPDFIICTHFLSAELFSRAKCEGRLHSQIITVITDFYPHSFWVNKGTDLYWVMSDEGKKDLMERGVKSTQITTGGIPVESKFAPQGKRHQMLEQHHFVDQKLTLLVTSGSFGLGPTKEILNVLEKYHSEIQVFVVCGNNKVLESELKNEKFSFEIRIFGFVDFMSDLMEASDLMIAKAGGSTTSESLAKGIPMAISKPIPGQETRNAKLLKLRNASFFVDEPKDVDQIVKKILENPETLTNKKKIIEQLAKPSAARDLIQFCLR
jgi:processive 1,2-diacylglycerol beta-glucosyltransferase